MFCFIALAVLAVMGIFSATHRVLAKEALDCVTRRVTFRPCNTGFREKVKGRFVGDLLKHSVFLAKMFNKYFELLAWIFFILTVWSLVATVYGGYNFYRYGSCGGLNQAGFCVLDPTGSVNAVSDVDLLSADILLPECSGDAEGGLLSRIPLNTSLWPTRNTGSVNEVIFIGCYECRFTRDAYPTIRRLVDNFDPNYTYINHPTHPGTRYLGPIMQCAWEENEESWWDLNDALFASEIPDLHDPAFINGLLEEYGYDSSSVVACSESEEMRELVRKQLQQSVNTGIYGTPLVFINDQPIVGPKPYRVYRFMMD